MLSGKPKVWLYNRDKFVTFSTIDDLLDLLPTEVQTDVKVILAGKKELGIGKNV